MNIIQFLTFFSLMTAAGTLAVTGWYFITRGEKETLPDGSIKRVGKIFKGWYFFWTKEKETKKKIFYKGDALAKIIAEVNSNLPYTRLVMDGYSFRIFATQDEKQEFPLVAIPNIISQIEHQWGVKLFPKSDGYFSVYKEYPDYVFPEWVRMPLAVCATCFSSIYAAIYYWGLIGLIAQPVFTWATYPWAAAIFFWGVFSFALSVLNTALAKAFN